MMTNKIKSTVCVCGALVAAIFVFGMSSTASAFCFVNCADVKTEVTNVDHSVKSGRDSNANSNNTTRFNSNSNNRVNSHNFTNSQVNNSVVGDASNRIGGGPINFGGIGSGNNISAGASGYNQLGSLDNHSTNTNNLNGNGNGNSDNHSTTAYGR